MYQLISRNYLKTVAELSKALPKEVQPKGKRILIEEIADKKMQELPLDCLKTALQGKNGYVVMCLTPYLDYRRDPNSTPLLPEELEGVGKLVYEACLKTELTCTIVPYLDNNGYCIMVSWS